MGGSTFCCKGQSSLRHSNCLSANTPHTITYCYSDIAGVISPSLTPRGKKKKKDQINNCLRGHEEENCSAARVITRANWQLCYQGGAQCRHQCRVFGLRDNSEAISPPSIPSVGRLPHAKRSAEPIVKC